MQILVSVYLRGSPQVQIWDSAVQGKNMGSGGLYNNRKYPGRPLVNADRPVGEWNTMRIRMVGESVAVNLNDRLVVDNVIYENHVEPDRPIYPTGPIELQRYGTPLQFRNLGIRELNQASPSAKGGLSGTDSVDPLLIQGEYAGKVGAKDFGVQVIAKGQGQFDAVVYPGGLPGAGWNAGDNIRHRLSGTTTGGTTQLSGEGFEATISNQALALKFAGNSGTLARLNRVSTTMGKPAPAGAIVLFDGTNVDQWVPGKLEESGLMGVGTRTKQVFENYHLHLEFRTPFLPEKSGQGRGNSGVYLGDQYECQILDSFGLDVAHNDCGGLYNNANAKLNMCYPPLQWQTYDLDFTCAKFDASGNVTTPARVTILLNGVLIHENQLLKPTQGGGRTDQKPGAIFLQDHGDAVRFRNIWLVEKN